MRALNAIYGIIKAALLFYQKFVGDLMAIGFKMNPYDPCVANNTINRKQLTLVWHVENIKASHVEEEVVTRMAKWLRKIYKRLFKDGSGKMKLCRGKVHDYLGMNLDYTIKGEVKIMMIPYIKEMIKDFREYDPSPENKANNPAAEFLFKVDNESRLVDDSRAKVFHTFVTKALFATKRSQPDIHTTVAFLTTGVRGPNKDDSKKLLRLMQYLRNTTDMPLMLRADGTKIVKL